MGIQYQCYIHTHSLTTLVPTIVSPMLHDDAIRRVLYLRHLWPDSQSSLVQHCRSGLGGSNSSRRQNSRMRDDDDTLLSSVSVPNNGYWYWPLSWHYPQDPGSTARTACEKHIGTYRIVCFVILWFAFCFLAFAWMQVGRMAELLLLFAVCFCQLIMVYILRPDE